VTWDDAPSTARSSPALVTLPPIVEEVAVVGVQVDAPPALGPHAFTVEITARGADGPPLHVETREMLVVEGPTPASARPLPVVLDGAEFTRAAAPGSLLPVTLRWRALQSLDHYASLSLRLVAPDGSAVAQKDGPPSDEAGTLEWQPGRSYGATWQIDLPPDLSPGLYTLEVFWYDPSTGQRAILWGAGRWIESINLGTVEVG
jgi:hypothetical protein